MPCASPACMRWNISLKTGRPGILADRFSTNSAAISKPSSALNPVPAKAYVLSSRNTGGNAVSSFDRPVTITMSYSSSDVSGIDESTLVIYRYDGSAWHALDSCSVDAAANTVSCATEALSTFMIFGTPNRLLRFINQSGCFEVPT